MRFQSTAMLCKAVRKVNLEDMTAWWENVGISREVWYQDRKTPFS